MRTRRLIVITPEGERELLFIGRLTVGRAPECDISLADTKISRRHAEFDASGPTPRVTDLGSRNGILINGRKSGAADLVPGDVVTVGDAQIRFDERVSETAERAPAAPAVDDRTAVLAPIMPPGGTGGAHAASAAAPEPPPPAVPPAVSSDPDKTSVLPRQAIAPPAPPVVPEAAPATADHTTVLPPPARAIVTPAVAPDPVRTARLDEVPPVAPVEAAPVASPVAPPPPVATAPPVASSVPPAAAPVATGAPAAAPSERQASGPQGPRFSWGGVVTLATVVLGGLAVLLGALPLISASASALDALSQRQARTLAGWLAAGVDPQATPIVKSSVLEAVLAQPGVERAMVLERATGRAVAPASLGGRTFGELPGIGEGWRTLSAAQVGRVDAFADAYVPAGDGAYVAWVRYERPSSNDTGLAVVVALVATLVLAMLIAMLIKRQTKATLQHFTRQVELAVSGASSKVMQGGLIPGLERLPGVVTYLLERKAGAAFAHGGGQQSLIESDDPDLGPAAPIDPGPPWLEVTPSLLVAESSLHGPDTGAAGWASAKGRHLLDVLDNGPVRNAVVQGLGALGMQSGAETTVPIGDASPIVLRREPTGHVRVTLAAR